MYYLAFKGDFGTLRFNPRDMQYLGGLLYGIYVFLARNSFSVPCLTASRVRIQDNWMMFHIG